MRVVKLRPKAQQDLESIWRYTREQWGAEQADRYLRELHRGFLLIADNPDIGKDRDALRKGYRSLQVEEHVVFYLHTASYIDVVRVLHKKMDMKIRF